MVAERKTIEDQGRLWALSRREKMETAAERKYMFVSANHSEFVKLPRLGPQGERSRRRFTEDIRYDPETGAIFIARWRGDLFRLAADEVTGRTVRVIPHPENYSLVSYADEFHPDPERLPITGKVIGLVVGQVWDGVETAIRQQIHILEKESPKDLKAEPAQLRGILRYIDTASARVAGGNVDPSEVERLVSEIAVILSNSRLAFAVDSDKQKIVRQLLSSFERDRLGRFNPLVVRTRLRSAFLACMRRLTVSDFIRRKFSANLEVLMEEREFSRFVLREVVSEIDSIESQLRSQGSGPDPEVLSKRVGEVAVRYLPHPRVAPYLIPARIAAIFLVGCREERKDLNRRVLGEEVAEEIFALEPTVELLSRGDLPEAGRRLRWARSVITTVLEEAQIEKEDSSDSKTV